MINTYTARNFTPATRFGADANNQNAKWWQPWVYLRPTYAKKMAHDAFENQQKHPDSKVAHRVDTLMAAYAIPFLGIAPLVIGMPALAKVSGAKFDTQGNLLKPRKVRQVLREKIYSKLEKLFDHPWMQKYSEKFVIEVKADAATGTVASVRSWNKMARKVSYFFADRLTAALDSKLGVVFRKMPESTWGKIAHFGKWGIYQVMQIEMGLIGLIGRIPIIGKPIKFLSNISFNGIVKVFAGWMVNKFIGKDTITRDNFKDLWSHLSRPRMYRVGHDQKGVIKKSFDSVAHLKRVEAALAEVVVNPHPQRNANLQKQAAEIAARIAKPGNNIKILERTVEEAARLGSK